MKILVHWFLVFGYSWWFKSTQMEWIFYLDGLSFIFNGKSLALNLTRVCVYCVYLLEVTECNSLCAHTHTEVCTCVCVCEREVGGFFCLVCWVVHVSATRGCRGTCGHVCVHVFVFTCRCCMNVYVCMPLWRMCIFM